MAPNAGRRSCLAATLVVACSPASACGEEHPTIGRAPHEVEVEVEVEVECETVAPIPVDFQTRSMFPVCDGAFVESDPSTFPGIDRLRRDYAWAQRELDMLFPGNERATVLFCRTFDCKIDFGADPNAAGADDLGFVTHVSREAAFETAVVVTGPGAVTSRTLLHEWIHVEMGKHAQYELMPTWFNEGVATFLAGEPACPRAMDRPVETLRSLDSKAQWQAHLLATGTSRPTYCQSRNEIAAWLGAFPTRVGAAAAVGMVLDAVARGSTFDAVYGPLRTE